MKHKNIHMVVMIIITTFIIQIPILAKDLPEVTMGIGFEGKVVPKDSLRDSVIDVIVPMVTNFVLDANTGEIISPDVPINNKGPNSIGIEVVETKVHNTIKGKYTQMKLVEEFAYRDWGNLSKKDSTDKISLSLKSKNSKEWNEFSPIRRTKINLMRNNSYLGGIPKNSTARMTLDGKFGTNLDDSAQVRVDVTFKIVPILE